MKNGRFKKDMIFILALLAISILVFGFYYLFIERTNPFSGLIEAIIKKEKYDNYNGIYTYTEPLDGTYFVYSGCNISKVNNHILIKDDKYYVYRSSCIGTFFQEEGETDKLTISVAKNDAYTIKYHDHEYVKDVINTSIVPGNLVAEKLRDIDISSVQLIANEVLTYDKKYAIDNVSVKGNRYFKFSINTEIGYMLIDFFEAGTNYTLYSYPIVDMKNLPVMAYVGSNVSIIERDDNPYNNNLYSYDLLFVTENGILYELKHEFPITVDGVELRYDTHSFFVKYNPSTRNYTVLVGNDKKMCDENFDNSNGDKIAYYEFSVNYNYLIGNFERPVFKKIGYMSEGCKYVNKILGG